MTDNFDKIDEHVLGNPQAHYSPEYIDHALRPRNVGSQDNANAYGCVIAHDGNTMEIWLRVEEDVIAGASFWTEGCGTTIACGSILTEIVRNKSVMQALEIPSEDLNSALGGLPGEGCTCPRLAVDTLRAALREYFAYRNEPWRRKYTRQ